MCMKRSCCARCFLNPFHDCYFGFIASPEPRLSRPANVQFHIGQVVHHKKWGYRGVIIGWDPEAKVGVLSIAA